MVKGTVMFPLLVSNKRGWQRSRNCRIPIRHFMFRIPLITVANIKADTVDVIPNAKLISELLRPLLPYRTLVSWVHWWSHRTAESLCKIPGVWEWAQYSDGTRRMDRWPYLCKSIFWPHRATPYLSVVEEEELVVCQVYPRKSRLLPMFRYPLLVSLNTKMKWLVMKTIDFYGFFAQSECVIWSSVCPSAWFVSGKSE